MNTTNEDNHSRHDKNEQLDESDDTNAALSDDDDEVEDSVLEDIQQFEESFKGISKRYRLINRIGEGKKPHRSASASR